MILKCFKIYHGPRDRTFSKQDFLNNLNGKNKISPLRIFY